MRYAKLSCNEFFPCCLQQCHSIDLFSYRTPGHDRKVIWIRSVRLSAQNFSWNWLLSFFQKLNMVLRAHVVSCMTARFFEKNVLPSKRVKLCRPRVLWMYRKVHFFSYFFIFLSVWSIMKVCITVIFVCLNKFHIWENSGFWDMAQNALGQSDCGIFQSIAGL